MLPVPIVLTAFGTTTRARETYDFMDGLIRAAFPGRDLHWAFSSRMVRDRLKDKKKSAARHPHEVLRALADQGHEWAVVQSVHLLCGHEFFRLIDEVQTQPIRTSIGLPLLSSREDYLHLAGALGLPENLPPARPWSWWGTAPTTPPGPPTLPWKASCARLTGRRFSSAWWKAPPPVKKWCAP